MITKNIYSTPFRSVHVRYIILDFYGNVRHDFFAVNKRYVCTVIVPSLTADRILNTTKYQSATYQMCNLQVRIIN